METERQNDGKSEGKTENGQLITDNKELDGLTEQLRSALNFVIGNFEKVQKVKVHYGFRMSKEMLEKLTENPIDEKGRTIVLNYLMLHLVKR